MWKFLLIVHIRRENGVRYVLGKSSSLWFSLALLWESQRYGHCLKGISESVRLSCGFEADFKVAEFRSGPCEMSSALNRLNGLPVGAGITSETSLGWCGHEQTRVWPPLSAMQTWKINSPLWAWGSSSVEWAYSPQKDLGGLNKWYNIYEHIDLAHNTSLADIETAVKEASCFPGELEPPGNRKVNCVFS